MLLKENKLFELPPLTGGSFSGMDRLYLPLNILVLKDINQRDDNGDITLICQAKDGPEQRIGSIIFSNDDRLKKDMLYRWLKNQIGKNIESIYNEYFTFGDKICPMCGSEMFRSMEPKVVNLANIHSKLPDRAEYWRCSNNDCDHREKI